MDIHNDEIVNDGRFPGGPTTEQIINERRNHRCESIWKGNVDNLRKSTRYHGRMMSKILLEQNGLRRKKLEKLGFGPITSYIWKYADINLCFAVAERFWPKTCTFHFPLGEMGITLDDTSHILGLSIVGKPLIAKPCDDFMELVTRCLGKLPRKTEDLQLIKDGKISLNWLIKEFATLPEKAAPIMVEYYTRAYILALCGCCLFPDSSGTSVDLEYLTVLEDMENDNYAWGAAVLSYLYSSLRSFVLSDKYDLRGCVVLLQVWAHLHFPSIGTPVVRKNLQVSSLAEKYCLRNRVYTNEPRALVYFRQELDLLKPQQVVWAPYPPWTGLMGKYVANRSCIICLDKVFYHPADRCMRQFRFRQEIPYEPLTWITSNSKKNPLFNITEGEKDWYDLLTPNSRFFLDGVQLTDDNLADGVSSDYKYWYGHPLLYNPNVTYIEPGFEPRGYGDLVADVLWVRSHKVADALDKLCELSTSNEEPWQSIRRLASTLRSTDDIPRRPQEHFVAPKRKVRFRDAHPNESLPTQEDDVYVPAPPDIDVTIDVPMQDGSIYVSKTPNQDEDIQEDDYGIFATPPYGQSKVSSSIPDPYTPLRVPPDHVGWEATQETRHVRPRLEVPRVPESV